MQPQDMPIELANGSVDGIAIYEPFAHFAIQQTGADKVFSIKSDDLYSEIIILVGKTDWISQNEKTALKIFQFSQKPFCSFLLFGNPVGFSNENDNLRIQIVALDTKNFVRPCLLDRKMGKWLIYCDSIHTPICELNRHILRLHTHNFIL